MLLISTIATLAQTVSGVVVDEEQAPINSAIVILCNARDTTQINYTITDIEGKFHFKSLSQEQQLLHISRLGYKAICLPAENNMMIALQTDPVFINEVVVKGKRPQLVQQHGKLIVNVDRTILADAGSITDVFKQTPGLIVNSNNVVEVFGKGSPTFFIDNKEVYSMSELSALLSTDIDKIEIDRNPSSEYSASSSVIVRITTKRSRVDNISVMLYDYLRVGRKVSNLAGVQFNNKKGKWSNLLSYSFSNSNHIDYSNSYETNTLPNYIIQNNGDITNEYAKDKHSLFSGNDYQINSKNKIGLQLSGNWDSGKSDKITNQTFSKSNQNPQLRRIENDGYNISELYSVNLNYKLNIDSLSTLNTNLNYVYTGNSSDEYILESNISDTNSSNSYLRNNGNYNVYSVEVAYSNNALFKWLDFSSGLKFSQIQNRGKSTMLEIEKNEIVFEQNNYIDDKISATYIDLKKQYKDFTFSAGLRYEYTSSHIKANSEQVNTSYHSLFPSAMIDYSSDKWSSTLSYSRRISRPSFKQLNPNMIYFDSLSYGVGNPRLKPVLTDNIELYTSAYNVNLILGYRYKTNYIINTAVNDDQNPDITKWTYLNINNTSTFTVGLTYSNQWKWYSGNVEFYVDKPNTRITFLDDIITIKKPTFYFSIGNTFDILDNLQLSVKFDYQSAGEDGITYYEPSYNLSASVVYKILKERMAFYLSVNDILGTANANSWEDRYGNIVSGLKSNQDYRYLRFGIRFNFNNIRTGINRTNIDEINRIQ